MQKIKHQNVSSLREFVEFLTNPEMLPIANNERYFRGEPDDYGKYFGKSAFTPSIYRNPGLLDNEPNIYREMQRFNDQEFRDDKSTVDKLSRMQHYDAPTRLIDMSEDALSALYFALAEGQSKDSKASVQEVEPVVYVVDVASKKLCYYDSDKVSVIANLVKSPLSSSLSDDTQKNKEAIADRANQAIERSEDIATFNEYDSVKFLLHDIKEEKPYFSSIIDPKHIFSVQCVKPKFTHSRINSQKGAFLLFGLNPDNIRESICLIEKRGDEFYLCHNSDNKIQHPVERITKIVIKADAVDRMRKELKAVGVKTPFIYPEMDKVAKYLIQTFSSR